MSNYQNPYEQSNPSSNNRFQQNRQGGFNRGKPEPKTPEELKRMRLPISIVVTGEDRISDSMAMTVDKVVKDIQERRITIRGGGNTDTDQVVTKAARYVEQHVPWAAKADDGKRYFDLRDGDRVEVRGNGSSFNTEECFEFAKRYFHGDYETVNKFRRANTAKNVRLLFGSKLRAPAQLVIVWSEDGAENAHQTTSRSGDIGHLVRMATASGIPVINLKNQDAVSRIASFLENMNVEQPTEESTTFETSERRQSQGAGSSGFQSSDDFDDVPL